MSKATLVGIAYEMWYDYIAVVVLHNFSELPLYGNKTCSSKPAYNQMKIQSYDWKCYILLRNVHVSNNNRVDYMYKRSLLWCSFVKLCQNITQFDKNEMISQSESKPVYHISHFST